MFSSLSEGYSVRMKGLEPPCLSALDPKSSASTSFATSALKFTDGCKFSNQVVSSVQILRRLHESEYLMSNRPEKNGMQR